MAERTKVLVIDDNESTRHDLKTVLGFLGEETIASNSTDWHSQAVNSIDNPSQVALAMIGLCKEIPFNQLLEQIYQWGAGIPFVVLGSQDMSELLDQELVTRIAARLEEKLHYQSLLDALHKAKLFHGYYSRLRDVDAINDSSKFHGLVGESQAIQHVRHMMGQVSNSEVSVLITGESGTGKEVVARSLHLNSARAKNPFIPINCGAIPIELLESELFGHEKGAFTGAISSRVGRFELADGGTLFLDEIGDMPPNMQVKLLRVLQERSFERVGGTKTIQTDVRIIAATHNDLEKMILEAGFRRDLYYRINVFPIEMPPLRDRAEDVPLLLNELITIMETERRGSVRFNSEAIASLCRHSWLGNVRELANLVERMSILYPHEIVGINDLPHKFRHTSDNEINKITEEGDKENAAEPLSDLQIGITNREGESAGQSLLPLSGLDLKEYLANLEKGLIEQALDYSGGVVARAADRLNIRRTTLVEKMRKYQLQKKQGDGEREVTKDVMSENKEVSTPKIVRH